MTRCMHANEEMFLKMTTPEGKFLTNGDFLSLCYAVFVPDKTETLRRQHTCQIMNMKQNQVITCTARIKYVALLNVLFYK